MASVSPPSEVRQLLVDKVSGISLGKNIPFFEFQLRRIHLSRLVDNRYNILFSFYDDFEFLFPS